VVFDVDELLVAELLVVSPALLVVVSVACVEPPNCCEAGSTFWFWDCGVLLCPAAIAATEANAVATTTPAAAMMTLADCRGVPLRFGGSAAPAQARSRDLLVTAPAREYGSCRRE